MQLTKEIFFPAFKELTDCLLISTAVLQEMELNTGVLKDERYKYLFTVEDVNDLVTAGVPFREAYREIGMKVQKGAYAADTQRTLNHTHEGSIGNLCLDRIEVKFKRHTWNYTKVLDAEKALMD